MLVYHNSHDTDYRSPFGAQPAGAAVTIRLDVREAAGCECTLRLWIEGSGEQLIPMRADGERHTCTLTLPDTPCLVWYYFLIRADGAVWYYGNETQLGGEGTLGETQPAGWQITVYEPDTLPDWYRRGIVYQIFPDRFARGADWLSCWTAAAHPDDWNGPPRLLHQSWRDTPFYTRDEEKNVTRWDFFGGTLSGIREHLLYLRSLGVTAIYLNPIFTASSNHKYDTADYLHVDPGFGGDEAFAALAEAARACGIRLILDGVFSHTGMDSLYFNRNGNYGDGGAYQDEQSPYRCWYHMTEDGYECWWGVADLPNVNELEPSYQAFILGDEDSVIRRWLRAGASGWRLDVADELPDAFIQHMHQAIRETIDDGLLMGEVWEDASHKESYGQRRRYLLGGELDCTMHYPFRTAVIDFMLGKADSAEFSLRMRSLQENYPPSALQGALNLLGSHDRARILTLMGNPEANLKQEQPLTPDQRRLGIARVKLLSLLQFTAPGVPCIYYGDEAGMEGGDDPCNRGPYPWGREDPELLAHYRVLAQLRQEHPMLTDADFLPLSFGADICGFLRTHRDEAILTLVNRSAEQGHALFYPTEAAYALDLLTGKPLQRGDTGFPVALPPLGCVCLHLRQQPPIRTPLERSAGVLCPVFSLPGPNAIGTMGASARAFLRFLHDAGQTVWQILPLNPVGLGDNPYFSPAVFAGDPRLIDPDEPVDESRYPAWRQENADWVEDYALFTALHDKYQRPWQEWPATVRRRENLSRLKKQHAEAVEHYCHEQFVFWQQWDALRAYANELGIRVFGDVPIYVSEDSADLWAHPEQFMLDGEGRPTLRAGVPPDYFSRDGQNWRNPIYNWDHMKADGYRWWLARLRHCGAHMDAVRIDHFRAFSAYFAIPDGQTPHQGQWLKGPGLAFWELVRHELGSLRLLAEDLGDLDAGVYSLLAETGFPGMCVWQFHADEMLTLPEARHRVYYSGTHDNQTLVGWLTEQGRDPAEAAQIIQALYASEGAWVILPLADLLGLGDEARINVPGVVGGNWFWRADAAQLTPELAARFRALTEQSGR